MLTSENSQTFPFQVFKLMLNCSLKRTFFGDSYYFFILHIETVEQFAVILNLSKEKPIMQHLSRRKIFVFLAQSG